jgi:hypothetical protein
MKALAMTLAIGFGFGVLSGCGATPAEETERGAGAMVAADDSSEDVPTCGRIDTDRIQLVSGAHNPGARAALDGKCTTGYFLCKVPSSKADQWCGDANDCFACLQSGG